MKKENVKKAEMDKGNMSRETFVRLQSVYSSLKTAEKKAADFMLKSPEKITENNITEAAGMAGCSEATLVRIAKRLGYGGYPELRSSIIKSGNADIPYSGITTSNSDADIIRKVFMASIRAIEDSLNMLDVDGYIKAVEILKKAKKVLWVGSGDALMVALSGCFKFSRIGFDARCMNDFDNQLVQASQLSNNDVVIAISYSGRTHTVYDVLKEAKSHNAKIIVITNVPVSPLTKQADAVLLTASFAQNNMGEIMTKRIPELCIIESLYISLIQRDPRHTAETLKESDAAINSNKL
jgi:DNA-binding MurR/RpiR family transcriptional regulator